MTLEEAIKHAEEVAEKNERRAESVRNRPISSADFHHEEESCGKCAAEHRQLAEWLKDYKRLLEAKTVRYEGDGYADGAMVYDMAECPSCGYEYEYGDKDWGENFCPHCGQRLRWEE